METLIFNGSPRPGGDTAALIGALTDGLLGAVTQVNAYDGTISACTDCRYCLSHPGCAISDGMDAVYRAIERADVIVVASPVFFSQLTGPLLSVFSRLQALYAARVMRGGGFKSARKTGVALLAGGGDGSPSPALAMAKCVLNQMNTELVYQVCSLNTNSVPAREDTAALEGARAVTAALNKLHGA